MATSGSVLYSLEEVLQDNDLVLADACYISNLHHTQWGEDSINKHLQGVTTPRQLQDLNENFTSLKNALDNLLTLSDKYNNLHLTSGVKSELKVLENELQVKSKKIHGILNKGQDKDTGFLKRQKGGRRKTRSNRHENSKIANFRRAYEDGSWNATQYDKVTATENFRKLANTISEVINKLPTYDNLNLPVKLSFRTSEVDGDLIRSMLSYALDQPDKIAGILTGDIGLIKSFFITMIHMNPKHQRIIAPKTSVYFHDPTENKSKSNIFINNQSAPIMFPKDEFIKVKITQQIDHQYQGRNITLLQNEWRGRLRYIAVEKSANACEVHPLSVNQEGLVNFDDRIIYLQRVGKEKNIIRAYVARDELLGLSLPPERIGLELPSYSQQQTL